MSPASRGAPGAFPPNLFTGSRFAVVGLGRNGLPAARALAAMGADIVAWDDRLAEAPPGLLLRDPTTEMRRFDALVLSPGIPHRLPAPHLAARAAIEAGVPILSDADLLYRAVRGAGSRARFVGITGTNGKSTTTALMAHIARIATIPVAEGGNLGPAALALPLLPDDGLYVLEMSSYMLERLAALRFDAAAMLNLTADHLDRHGDLAGYAAAKREIFARRQPDDVAVIAIDDENGRMLAAGLGGRVVTVATGGPADIRLAGTVLFAGERMVADLAAAPALPGRHNAQNAAVAAGLALSLGLDIDHVGEGIRSFPGLPHRQERVGTIEGVTFINDSKATNADAAAWALACHERLVWIAGGLAKTGGIDSLSPFFPNMAHVLLIGQDAGRFAATLARAGVSHEIAVTLDDAVPRALDAARLCHAHTVLLSPAAASFDQFASFEARGDRFRELVGSLGRAA